MSIPLGVRVLPNVRSSSTVFGTNRRLVSYQTSVLILTFLTYVSYHLSRKPLSVIKNSLHKNCSSLNSASSTILPNDTTWCDWSPFEGDDYEHLFGWLDVGFLGTYAACMFLSGYVAERMNLRYFLTVGMLCSGASVAMFGVGYFLNIHNFYFYLVMQMIAGGFQSTGWPAVVATVGNWFGPGRRGAIMGIWNSHTSVGNILGALIPGIWADGAWGWGFIVPGIIIGSLGVVVFFFLVPYPKDVGIEIENSRGKADGDVSVSTNSSVHNEETPLIEHDAEDEHEAVSLKKALLLPGVIEFSLCLFFAKLVSYTFLFWLPKYIKASMPSLTGEKAADLSTLFDVGGVVGGFIAGAVTDHNVSPGINCVVLLAFGTPMLFVYQAYGSVSYGASVALLLVCGALVNGPYALITTAVSAELGTQKALQGNKKALATVTSIIDGTGSIGAALGPLLTGWISPTGWKNVFYMLISANIMAACFLVRIVRKEARKMCCGYVPPDDEEDVTHVTKEIYPDTEENVQQTYENHLAEQKS
ncbi:glucose-6-phosphate exchanger SLC37A2-like isoform X2 [Littorina saxatilis]|uniref:Sugar phosphate exchanger 3 n=1 Tax=Littorina saxatilis TaxID=31220 RepID=A0AAN9GFU2_9CAEN